jgi:glycosyltransferase involved in cell wall biosynthesis
MGEPGANLVTAVIPAYNAAATLDETLLSVRRQTHAELEILVVDDGSADRTPEIALEHARGDPRVRLITQVNGGVAAARNRGLAEATADFVAPVDADDLWRPEKIELQLRALRQGGERVGLVYTWFALIDERSRVLQLRYRPTEEGDVRAALAERNFIGNGSSVLMRKSVALAVGGYDASLRDRKAQGCEDWRLYFQVAERSHFAVVKDFLTGYRRMDGNMSSDVLQMLRSRDLSLEDIATRYPEYRRQFHSGRNRLARFLFNSAVRRGRTGDALKLLNAVADRDRVFAARLLAALPVRAATVLAERSLRGLARGGSGLGADFLQAST